VRNWQRAFVWIVGTVHIASGVFLMMVVGAIAQGPPNPAHVQDALLGLALALALHAGLMLAPLLVTARPSYRALAATAMLPAAFIQAKALAVWLPGLPYDPTFLWSPGPLLALSGTVAYAAQFYWLARGRHADLVQAAA
jgi:hypothetical protein